MFESHLARVQQTRWVWLGLIAMPALPAAAPFDDGAAGSDAPPARPNLLILIADDHGGGTLGIDGDPRRATPRLDRARPRRGSGSPGPIATPRSARQAGNRSSPAAAARRRGDGLDHQTARAAR